MSSPGLFEGTARYYAEFRRGYPDAAFDHLVDRFGLSENTHVLDLGCGTGQIAIPLARRGIPVRAVDPDPDMIAHAVQQAAAQGVLGVSWQLGNDAQLARLHLPLLSMCTMGSSFHWTHRDQLLGELDGRIAQGGAVVILETPESDWEDPGARWKDIAASVVREFLGPGRRAGGGTYSHPPERHEVVLARSAFCIIERMRWTTRTTLTINDIVGFQLSTSYSSPGLLGPHVDAFRATLAARLGEAIPAGRVNGTVTTEALIASRR